MKLVPINGTSLLKFELEKNDDAAIHAEFLAAMEKYEITKQGSRINFYNRNSHKLDACMNIGDNSFFILENDGVKLSAFFGTKRFVLGADIAKREEMTNFARDRAFPLVAADDAAVPFKVVTLLQLLEIRKSNLDLVYEELAQLFNRCADFTPAKQHEYVDAGQKIDKFKRFNLENNAVQVFLLDDKNKIVGTCSAIVLANAQGKHIYVYDEVVDQEAKASLSMLFQAMRQQLRLSVSGIEQARAFIRVAAERVDAYVKLGCSAENQGQLVIHGGRTDYAKVVDACMNEWAEKNLQVLKTPQFSIAAAIGEARYGKVAAPAPEVVSEVKRNNP